MKYGFSLTFRCISIVQYNKTLAIDFLYRGVLRLNFNPSRPRGPSSDECFTNRLSLFVFFQ